MKRFFAALLLAILPALAFAQTPNQQALVLGAENNSMSNNGGNLMFPIVRPFTVTSVGGVTSMFQNKTGTATHIAAAANTQIYATGGGWLHSVVVNTTAAGAITIVDTSVAACTGGTTLAILPASVAVGTYTYDVPLVNGLCITTGAASDITVSSIPGVLSQCLARLQVFRQTPPRFNPSAPNDSQNGVSSGVVGGLSTSQGSIGLINDPVGVTPHGDARGDALWSSIVKAFVPINGTGASATSSYGMPINNLVLNSGDWLGLHHDCSNPANTTVDAESQVTLLGTQGAIPKYVQWFSDNFTRANENPLSFSGWWTKVTASPATLQVLSNALQPVTASTNAVYYFNVASGGSNVSQPMALSGSQDQFVDLTIAGSGASCAVGNACVVSGAFRFSTTAQTGYILGFAGQAGSGATWFIDSLAAGVATVLLSGTATIPVGNIIRGEVQGTTLTVKNCTIGGVTPVCTTLGSVTDSTYTTGQVGVYIAAGTVTTDNKVGAWDAGSINF